jgi:hypothetical protein
MARSRRSARIWTVLDWAPPASNHPSASTHHRLIILIVERIHHYHHHQKIPGKSPHKGMYPSTLDLCSSIWILKETWSMDS